MSVADLLSLATLDRLPAAVERPAFDPATLPVGVVHFGPGAFHRAHQAAYFDSLAATDQRWGISGVSLRTPGVVDALAAQDGLYSLTMLGAGQSVRVIGAHREQIRPGETARLQARLIDPAIRLVTTTVTEKGYCLNGEGKLDLEHADIVHDLERPIAPASVIGWIAAGLAARHAASIEPFAVLCCDNMTGNGGKLRDAVLTLAREWDASLADWIERTVIFPDSMVDSITPATDAAHLARAATALGMIDAAAVQREPFTQWVLADAQLPGDPDLASVGVIRTRDVAAFERAKLRILNGSHSALAYLGSVLGHESVADAMNDDALETFVAAMVADEIIPLLAPNPDLDPVAYAQSVFARFRNPGIRHLLSQIAWDGSQKLPYRLLSTASEGLSAGRVSPRIAVVVAGWIAFMRERAARNEPLTDPMADRLIGAAMSSEDARAVTQSILAVESVFPAALAQDAGFAETVSAALAKMLAGDARSALI